MGSLINFQSEWMTAWVRLSFESKSWVRFSSLIIFLESERVFGMMRVSSRALMSEKSNSLSKLCLKTSLKQPSLKGGNKVKLFDV